VVFPACSHLIPPVWVWQSGIKYQKAAIDESGLFGYAVLVVFPRAR